MKGDTMFTLYGDLIDILGFRKIHDRNGDPLDTSGNGRSVRSSKKVASMSFPAEAVVDLRPSFESLYVYSGIVEPRVVGDKIVPLLRIVPITGQHGVIVTTCFDHVQYIPESIFWNDRNIYMGRHWPTSPIRTGKCDGDTTLSTVQHWPIHMNYDDYCTRQVGGALPYFTGARVQRGHGFGSLCSGLLRSVALLINRGALALGKRAPTTGAQITGDVMAGQNIKKATKRRATAAGRALMSSLLVTPPPPGKRKQRTAPSTIRIRLTAARRRTSPTKRQRQRPATTSICSDNHRNRPSSRTI